MNINWGNELTNHEIQITIFLLPRLGVVGVIYLEAEKTMHVMITQLRFENFKALKNAELKLGAFNVIVGPNGSGKSSVLQGLEALADANRIDYPKVVTAGTSKSEIKIIATYNNNGPIEYGGISIDSQNKKIFLLGNEAFPSLLPLSVFRDVQRRQASGINAEQARNAALQQYQSDSLGSKPDPSLATNPNSDLKLFFQNFKVFSFETTALGQPVGASNLTELSRDGRNLAGAITHLHDQDEDAYNQLRLEFQRWIPEYDGIGFDTDQSGTRSLALRQKTTRQRIPASQLSEGTLLALALLTIIYQSKAPILIGLEEPDRGLHPRLLRELRDALYRLSFPSDFGIKRNSVQVVVTTHSPFFLDLFKDHPEQVIIADKSAGGTSTFKNLSDDKELRELIGDAPLGEVWYSGILGGVPVAA